MIQDWFGFTRRGFPADGRGPGVRHGRSSSTAARPFLAGAVSELRARQPGMMLLIAHGDHRRLRRRRWRPSFGCFDLEFWWELAALIVDHAARPLAGDEGASARRRARWRRSPSCCPTRPSACTTAGRSRRCRLARCASGDVVLVRPGGRVPADGEVVDGAAELDESMITGESRPVAQGDGRPRGRRHRRDRLGDPGRVDAVGEDTALAGIQRLVAEAQASRSRAQALADRAAALLFYVAAGAGVVTFVVWIAARRRPTTRSMRTVTVLVIACPHALGLAIPLVIAISTALAARAGILVRDRLGARADAQRRRGAVRQDRHADPGRARRDRRRPRPTATTDDAARGSPPPSRRTASIRSPARSSPPRRERRRDARRRRDFRVADRPRRRGDGRRATRRRRRARRCCASAGLESPPSSTGTIDGWRGARRGGAARRRATGRSIGALALEDEVRPEVARGGRASCTRSASAWR